MACTFKGGVRLVKHPKFCQTLDYTRHGMGVYKHVVEGTIDDCEVAIPVMKVRSVRFSDSTYLPCHAAKAFKGLTKECKTANDALAYIPNDDSYHRVPWEYIPSRSCLMSEATVLRNFWIITYGDKANYAYGRITECNQDKDVYILVNVEEDFVRVDDESCVPLSELLEHRDEFFYIFEPYTLDDLKNIHVAPREKPILHTEYKNDTPRLTALVNKSGKSWSMDVSTIGYGWEHYADFDRYKAKRVHRVNGYIEGGYVSVLVDDVDKITLIDGTVVKKSKLQKLCCISLKMSIFAPSN